MLSALVFATPAQASWRRYRVADPAATLRRVNVLRASFGARPLKLVRAWSDGCARHIAYIRRNGFGHGEVPGRPGYSASGALAGETSVLFSPPAEPFRTRLGAWADDPYHQVQVLDPRLTRTGFSLGCMNTMRGLAPQTSSAGPPRLLAWPGDGARRVPRSIDACHEVPSDPFTAVGWSCRRAGTALYVYALSAGCTAAPVVTLTPPVPLRVLPAGDCDWIVLTGLPLPAAVAMDVRLDGETLRSAFTTAR